MDDDEHVARVRERCESLAEALTEATAAGVSPAKILPVLMEVFRASGLTGAMQVPGGFY